MPSVQTITLFMATALALNVTPGPSILFILSRCLGQGRRKGAIASVFGLATASVIQAFGTAFGLSALFVYSPIIKYCGPAYLIYLGVSSFLKGGIAHTVAKKCSIADSSPAKSLR
jgi:threonine/homoserine/homoserine lactone efflux protein